MREATPLAERVVARQAADPTTPLAPVELAALIRQRLRERHSDLKIYGILDLAAGKPKLRVPCAAVLPIEDRPAAPASPDPDVLVVQRVTTVVAVVVGVAAPNDLGGTSGAASDALAGQLHALRRSLLGWTPGGPFPTDPPLGAPLAEGLEPAAEWSVAAGGRLTPLVWQRGRLLMMGDSRAWWQDEYSTSWIARSAPHDEQPGPFAGVRDLCVQVAVPEGAEPGAPVPVAR